MKCIVCGRAVEVDQGNRFSITAHGQVIPACGPEHQQLVRNDTEKYYSLLDSCC